MVIYITLESHVVRAITGEMYDKEIFRCPSTFIQLASKGKKNNSCSKKQIIFQKPRLIENLVSCALCLTVIASYRRLL